MSGPLISFGSNTIVAMKASSFPTLVDAAPRQPKHKSTTQSDGNFSRHVVKILIVCGVSCKIFVGFMSIFFSECCEVSRVRRALGGLAAVPRRWRPAAAVREGQSAGPVPHDRVVVAAALLLEALPLVDLLLARRPRGRRRELHLRGTLIDEIDFDKSWCQRWNMHACLF